MAIRHIHNTEAEIIQKSGRYKDIRHHVSRVTDKVNEGKRKFLWVAAFPETSIIPRVVPIGLSLLVSIEYSPSELKFKIMSDHSETGSRSPSLVVEFKVVAFLKPSNIRARLQI